MAHLNIATKPAAGRVEAVRAPRSGNQVGLYQCLIVSTDAVRRDMLAQWAAAAGWEPVLCNDPAEALAACSMVHIQLATVDLESVDVATHKPLLEKLATTEGLLLVVCGKEGDLQEEIYVRQVGAWLYLPGAMDGDQMSLLCTEARTISERSREKSKQPRAGGSGPGRPKQRRV